MLLQSHGQLKTSIFGAKKNFTLRPQFLTCAINQVSDDQLKSYPANIERRKNREIERFKCNFLLRIM